MIFIALAIPIALLVFAGYLFKRARADAGLPQRSGSVRETDLALELPASASGVASNGQEIIVVNRKDPWGLLRIRPKKNRFMPEMVALIEPRYSQKIQLHTLTWNGEHYVGLASGAWFGVADNKDVFTIHDPNTLQVIRHVIAPPLIGCIAWDGTSYWASTRKNTLDADEKAFLYRLDRELQVLETFDPPAVGCQGLLWDGFRLWFADVFDDAIYLVDRKGNVLHRAPIGLDYLSGLALHDGAVWIAEYGEHRLHRLKPSTRIAWTGAQEEPGEPPAAVAASAIATRTEGPDEATLRQQLRSEHWAERMRADMELDRRGASVDFARDQNNFVDREPEGTDDIDWSIELRDGAIWLVSSRLWFGPELFVKREQTSSIVTVPVFARYTYTVKHPDGRETEKVFDAIAGENVRANVRLADATASGTYSVSLFIHVQYVDANGGGKILNNSAGFLELRR